MSRSLVCSIVIFLLVSPFAEAGAPPRAGWRKADLFARPNASAPATLFTLPNASDAAQLAADVPFDILDTYSNYYLISVAIDRIERLRELATPRLMGFWEFDLYDRISTPVGEIDTRYPISLPTGGLPDANYAPGQWGLHLIQFHGPEKDEWITAIRGAGAVPISFAFWNAYYIAATPEVAAAIQQLPFVQWSTPLHSYLKWRPQENDYVNGLVHLVVRVPRGEGGLETIERIFGPNVQTWSYGNVIFASGDLTSEQVTGALKEPLVMTIDTSGGSGGGGGGGPAQIPTLSPLLLAALAIVLAAVALRR